MILFRKAEDINKYLTIKVKSGETIGFTPTMGALHEGHLSLLKNSKQYSTVSVVSIFINPTQFNDSADFAKYPVTLSKDILALEQSGCDVLFLPGVVDIYPFGFEAVDFYGLDGLDTVLEGAYRPGHFQGVCQVMSRLLEIMIPNTLLLGQKDYQQCMVISKLTAILKKPMDIKVIPTCREKNGLAMSSRNLRLTDSNKLKAAHIFEVLTELKQQIKPGETGTIQKNAHHSLRNKGFHPIDYISIVDAKTLAPITIWDGQTSIVALVAAYVDGIRLIDNMLLYP